MTLEEFGFRPEWNTYISENDLDGYEVGRIIAEHKERYIVRLAETELDAEITGNLRFTARSREDFPAVGDWVVLTRYDSDFGIIHSILPRFSTLKRKAVGQSGEIQIIAANIDYAFIILSVDRDFNLNRIERYLTICNTSGVEPLIILSKIDLIGREQLMDLEASIKERIPGIPVIPISNLEQESTGSVSRRIEPGKTYCLLGSSGVGKSTLLNRLSGNDQMRTAKISDSTSKGRHTTSHRELFLLNSGGILIDNPGMREVGITDSPDSLQLTFDRLMDYAAGCRFKDCKHINESGCAVREAVGKGEIDRDSYENYLKMEREQSFFESSVEERRKKEKDFGKILKHYKKIMKDK